MGTLSFDLLVYFVFFEIGCQVAQASFKFPNISTRPHNWWDHRHVPPYQKKKKEKKKPLNGHRIDDASKQQMFKS